MEQINFVIHFFQTLPEYINLWSQSLGPLVYLLLFSIIFAETGLIVTPFLPGDSLLFAAGALTTSSGPLSLPILIVTLFVAAIMGDFLNYSVGRAFGQRVAKANWKFINKAYVARAEQFYEKHGGKAVVFARFFPLMRTYAPFVAGMSRMPRDRYIPFNILGAGLWIFGFTLAGHFFADLPFVKDRFHVVILGIIGISILPAIIEFIRARKLRENH